MSFSDKFSGENRDFPGDNKAFRRKKANCKGTGDVVGWGEEGDGGMEIRIERREEYSTRRLAAEMLAAAAKTDPENIRFYRG